MTRAPTKLKYTIISCSGEDPDHPVRELLYHSPHTRGWQTPRFCKYPQELVLRLEKPSRIATIQILSHEFKIASKIEVFVSSLASAESEPSSMKRLGYISFDSNEKSGYQARELKSVAMNQEAHIIRLVAHRCHINKLNIYNQVGVVAFNLIGEHLVRDSEGPLGYLKTVAPGPVPAAPTSRTAAAAMADLSLDVNVDPVTAERIRSLASKKEQAVKAEDYDEAKRLKADIERLKVLGSKIAQLEARKQAAVESEDYDAAKSLKADVEQLRSATDYVNLGAAGAEAGSTGGARNPRDPDQIFSRVLGQAPQGHKPSPSRALSSRSGTSPAATIPSGHGSGIAADGGAADGADAGPSARYVTDAGAPLPELRQGAPADSVPLAPAQLGGEVDGGYGKTVYQAYDDRPAVGRGTYLDGGADISSVPPPGPSMVNALPAPGLAAGGRVPGDVRPSDAGSASMHPPPDRPEDFPADLAVPEPLTAGNAVEAEPLVELCGEYVARAALSRTWQLRDAALQHLHRCMSEGRLPQDAVFRTTAKVCLRAVKDKVPQVFTSARKLAEGLVDMYATAVSAAQLNSFVSALLPILVQQRLADGNARISSAARDLILSFAAKEELGLAQMTSVLVKPVKNTTAWKAIKIRLEMLLDLLPLIPIAAPGAARGFELPALMDFVARAFTSSNGDTRATALLVTQAVADRVGSAAVRKHLPNDLNAKLKEQLDQLLQHAGGSAPGAAPRGMDGGGEGRSRPAGPPGPSRAAAAARAAAPGPSRSRAASGRAAGAPAAGAGYGNGAAPPGAPPGGGSSPLLQAGKQEVEAASLPEDDPTRYEEALKLAESRFGPDHADTVEAVVNLAIVYNQRQQADRAKPLYQRALATLEQLKGPNSQEVAHMLTDLAVIYLEEGRDDLGRPLLERALGIQQSLLGPDHPDVEAIRDVLNSEE